MVASKKEKLEIKDKIIIEIIERHGYCGHCGKKSCPGKLSFGRPPRSIGYSNLMKILNEVLGE